MLMMDNMTHAVKTNIWHFDISYMIRIYRKDQVIFGLFEWMSNEAHKL
jgi:hypothetical protein